MKNKIQYLLTAIALLLFTAVAPNLKAADGLSTYNEIAEDAASFRSSASWGCISSWSITTLEAPEGMCYDPATQQYINIADWTGSGAPITTVYVVELILSHNSLPYVGSMSWWTTSEVAGQVCNI